MSQLNIIAHHFAKQHDLEMTDVLDLLNRVSIVLTVDNLNRYTDVPPPHDDLIDDEINRQIVKGLSC